MILIMMSVMYGIDVFTGVQCGIQVILIRSSEMLLKILRYLLIYKIDNPDEFILKPGLSCYQNGVKPEKVKFLISSDIRIEDLEMELSQDEKGKCFWEDLKLQHNIKYEFCFSYR